MSKPKDKRSIYIIRNKRLGQFKIGISKDPERRRIQLMGAAGCQLDLMYNTKPVENYTQVEKYMHALYSNYRGFGEWFTCDYKNAIVRLKVMIKDGDDCTIVNNYLKGYTAAEIGYKTKVHPEGLRAYLKMRLKLRKVK